MSRPVLDAATLAERMNARPLDEDTDGGEWTAYVPVGQVEHCESCLCIIGEGVPCVASGGNALLALCLPCALMDSEQAALSHAFKPAAFCACGEHWVNGRAVTSASGTHARSACLPSDWTEAEHRAADPHCTCPDCIHYLAAHLEG